LYQNIGVPAVGIRRREYFRVPYARMKDLGEIRRNKKEKYDMSKEVIAILQCSLGENERIKRRQFAAFALLFLATLCVLAWIAYLGSRPAADLREMVVWSVIAMVVAITYGVMALAIYINRTVTRLLRTLQSVSEKS
jgi:hypothetical protein